MAVDHFLPFIYPSGHFPFLNLELSFFVFFFFMALFALWLTPGGLAWAFCKTRPVIPGPSGLPGLGLVSAFTNNALTHRILANLSKTFGSKTVMAFSVGSTRFVVSSDPNTAKELLNSSAFADRPIKESAYGLLFHRAMGFAPYGEYWRNLRRISAIHLFSPKRIASFEGFREEIGRKMVEEINYAMGIDGEIQIKRVLHFGSLNNVMMSVFGKRYDFTNRNRGNDREGEVLENLVKEGYNLLGIFNWGDYLPVLGCLDLQGVKSRCRDLVAKVNVFVGEIIEEHRAKRSDTDSSRNDDEEEEDKDGDFVDVLLGLQKDNKLDDSDMIAVLWEMIFRGTDTIAILLEWILARMVLHPDIQSKAQSEISTVAPPSSGRKISGSDLPNLPYLRAIVKETLRMHPPGPLLSWARLSIHDSRIGPHVIPAGTTAMVNMWAITHDPTVWPEAERFRPERFLEEGVNSNFPIMGSDLRLAPFGSGRRVCPGKSMGLATVELWLAQLLQEFKWVARDEKTSVDLTETLKLSMEMKNPLVCKAISRVYE